MHADLSFDPDRVRADFDRIAAAGGSIAEDHGRWILRDLLARVPSPRESALDLGCGSGDLVRRLAADSRRVVGLDLSPRMLELARRATADRPNVELVQADFMTSALPIGSFDLVCAVATLHHLDFEPALRRAASLVRPGGHLLVVDLYAAAGLRGFLGYATSWVYARWLDRGRPRPSATVRAAWRAHGAHDRYPTSLEIRRAAESLPGAEVAIRLPWRWSLLWRKPA